MPAEPQQSIPRAFPVNRAFRVKLSGTVPVIVHLPNKREVKATFHQLSLSGGMMHLDQPLDEKLDVEFDFEIRGTTIHAAGQMLFPMWATQGWLQPFRILQIADEARSALDAVLKSFVDYNASQAAVAGA